MTSSDAPAPALRRLPPLLASLVAVVLAGATPQPGTGGSSPIRGTGAWTVTGTTPENRCATGDCRDEEVVHPFLLAHTDAQAVVTGPVAHTVLRQEWTNPNLVALDGTYIFPLPDNAAVTGLTLTIGSRRIEAEMRRREEARAVYEQARRAGQVAALLDQERQNIFAQQVANIMPGERIDITIEFDHELRCDDGTCEYILPTVVGPRFVPARQGDPGRIAPPVTLGTGHRLTFTLDLDEGMPIHDLESPSHTMAIQETGFGRANVRLAAEETRLDRDVVVRFRLGGRDAEFGVLAFRGGRSARAGGDDDRAADGASPARDDGAGIFTLFLMPPVIAESEAQATPRELTFVLDCSGSMTGEPIEAAKEVVRRSLRAARASDTLQILRFSDQASGLWPDPVAVTPANVKRALEFLDTLHGEGGTEMLSGIRAALDRPADRERLRLVSLLTDGYIGNEAEVLAEVRRVLGPARLFAFGIGSSVNRYLLENLAQEGRGTASFLARGEDPEQLVTRFVKRISTPVLTDLRLSWEGIDVDDLEPALPPDLFAGQPLVIHGRYRRPGAGALVLEGVQQGGRRLTLRRTVALPAYAEDHEALARLWARSRIDRLTRESYGRPGPDAIAAITDLALRFRLMTSYTSLVAVDHVVSNHGGVARSLDVPVELPAGMDPVNAGRPQEAAMRVMVTGLPQAKVLGRNAGGAPPGAPAAGSVIDKMKEEARRQAASSPPANATPPPSPRTGRDRADRAPSDRDRTNTRPVPPIDPAAEPDAVSFVLIRLVEEDGTTRTIESDGEAWLVAQKRRTLVRTLSTEEVRALRKALYEAGAEHWTHGDATFARGRARLVVLLGDSTTHSIEVPSGDPTVEAIVTLLRAATLDAMQLPSGPGRR
ncbi:MAG TPA: VIT domain-containing protein [Verrucomicrobiae bacterium]|nr:VIT domain-containing protein [Verrucomicrobiae bacterium]